MNLHKQKDQHNTPDEVKEWARQAVGIADELALAAEDRAVLLPAIMDELSSAQVFYEQVPTVADLAQMRPQG